MSTFASRQCVDVWKVRSTYAWQLGLEVFRECSDPNPSRQEAGREAGKQVGLCRPGVVIGNAQGHIVQRGKAESLYVMPTSECDAVSVLCSEQPQSPVFWTRRRHHTTR